MTLSPELLDEYLELTERLHEANDLLDISPDTASQKTLLPHQQPPPPPWRGWVLTGGRGGGKTMAGTHWLADLAVTTPGLRARIITPTLSDAVNGAVLDPNSGILAASPSATFHPSGPEGVRVPWPNGSTAWCVGTPTLKDADRLRALSNIDVDLMDEAAANPQLPYVFEQASLSRRGTRLPQPLWAATTTPRPLPTIRQWLQDPNVVVTRASTFDNPHTPDTYREYATSLQGTRAYRQEVLGELLEDVEGALWTLRDLERSTLPQPPLREFSRIAVGVDPPSGSGTCGIVVVGLHAATQHIYVLEDCSLTNAFPSVWGRAVTDAALRYDAIIVAETNQGGRMVAETIHNADPASPVTDRWASVGKDARAEPIAVMWEATHQTAHLSPPPHDPTNLDALTRQLTEWAPHTGQSSPDLLDAMTWAARYLKAKRTDPTASFYDPLSRTSAIALPPSPTSSFTKALMSR